MTWGGTRVAVVIKESGVIVVCETTLLRKPETLDALEPSAPAFLGCVAVFGTVDTLGGGVTDGEFITLEETWWTLVFSGTVEEESVVAGRAVPLSESSRALDPAPVRGLFEGRTHPTVGPKRSCSKSSGGEVLVSMPVGRTFWRGGRAGGLACRVMPAGTAGRAGTSTGFVHLTATSDLTVFFELVDAGEPGARGLNLGLGWKKPCPSGPFLDFSAFFSRASRGISSFSFDSQMVTASSKS
jgi:hypothetical protein